MVFQYDPKNIAMIVGGSILSGFSDATFVNAIRNEDGWMLKVGVDGEGTRSKNNNKSGRYEIELMQSSPSNDILSNFAALDEASGTGAVPVLLKDNNGTTISSALTAWVKKYPDSPYAKETGTRKWIIETDLLNIFVGGEATA